MKYNSFIQAVILIAMLLYCTPAHADIITHVLEDIGEVVVKIGSRGAAHSKSIGKYGKEAAKFFEITGEKTGQKILKDAGEKAPQAIKFINQHGEKAVMIMRDCRTRRLFLEFGPEAGEAICRHPGIAESLIEKYGSDAAAALTGLSRKSAQRLAILSEDGFLSATSRSEELLKIIKKYGNEAMDFIWRNKGALTVSAVLVSFLNDPETYMRGMGELLVEPAIQPVTENTNWTLVIPIIFFILLLPAIIKSLFQVLREKYHEKKENKAKNTQPQASGSMQAREGSSSSQRQRGLQA